ncbi:MAG: pyruvate, phosphate dikinase [Chloroflexi bacterium]|nr:MAG: pyruvate, phosphate dikinase [Chloroflexota bacterium]
MKPYTLPLSDPHATLETVGGKGLSLAKMINAGLPVPDGFHITTEAYRQFIDANNMQAKILSALHDADLSQHATLEIASATIGSFFAEGKIPTDVETAIWDAYNNLDNRKSQIVNRKSVAVRSSATAEDLPGASFAGQQETYLNIRGEESLLEAVKKCWASLWTARAIAYRIKNNIDQNTVALAVVVQEMIFAEAAGIMFTVNPLNGRRNELVINAAWGLGEAIVGGLVSPDTLTVDKQKSKVIRRETAEKLVMTVRTERGTSEVPVPDFQKKKAVLSDAQALELARLGKKIEEFYEVPMDVEWTLVNGKFAVVQARPITALPPEWKVEPKTVYGRGSLAEHTPSPVTPLFATLGMEIANRATEAMWERMFGAKAKEIITTSEGAYAVFNGYVYGGFRMDARAMGVILRVSLSQLAPIFRGSVARWQAARQELAAVVEAWEKKPIESLTPSELLEGVRIVFGAACRYFTQIQTTLPAASMSEIFFTRIYNSLIRRKQDPEATVFLLGSETVALQAEKSLFNLAMWLRTNSLEEHILRTPNDQLLADLGQASPPQPVPANLWNEWQTRFQKHLDEFGRTAYEFDFANPTPVETPGPLLDAIKAFLEGKAHDPYQRQREAVAKREQATQSILNRVGWPRRGWFQKLLHWAQDTGPMRENSIFDMGMGHPLIRRMFAELGRRFVAGGAIGSADDIYWLEKSEVEELIAALEEGKPLQDFNERIPARKAEWQSFLKLTPPVMLPEKTRWNKLVHGDEAEKKDGKTILKGIGTSGGTITAPARVLFGPEDFNAMRPGEVLVAVTTTPAWTPLFAMASAVVTDIGGPLSHSSIVAREYGIPAVMAARGATRHIQSGQMVTVNGSTGTVILDSV